MQIIAIKYYQEIPDRCHREAARHYVEYNYERGMLVRGLERGKRLVLNVKEGEVRFLQKKEHYYSFVI